MVSPGPLGERHEDDSSIQQFEHRRDRRPIEVADQRNDRPGKNLSGIQSRLRSDGVVRETAFRTDQERLVVPGVATAELLEEAHFYAPPTFSVWPLTIELSGLRSIETMFQTSSGVPCRGMIC